VRLARPLPTQVPSARKRACCCVSEIVCACFAVALAVPLTIAHWGGGMFINAYDMARFGYLFLRHGTWNGRSIVSEKWIEMACWISGGPALNDFVAKMLAAITDSPNRSAR
jgi:CubicO group peptidase (beta-lactamase class C family)